MEGEPNAVVRREFKGEIKASPWFRHLWQAQCNESFGENWRGDLTRFGRGGSVRFDELINS